MRRPHPLRVSVLAAVALGGVLGASARYGLGVAVPEEAGAFPWTTFGVNVTGCLLLALLPALRAVRRHPLLPPLLGTGVLGGFTTLSTYAEQARSLLDRGATALALAYVVGTLASCLLAVAVAGRFTAPSARQELEAEEGDL